MTSSVFNIRHYAALAATVRHGSVTKAARAVHLTQPALTQAIARLETELDCALFERRPDGMTPTEAARILAPRAEAAIAHIGSPRVTGTQMRAFLAVAKSGSYGGAAEETGLANASLHRAVAGLSLALGQNLLDRRGRGIMLTQAGQRRARGFGLAMAELRAGLAELAAWKGKAEGRIVVGAMPLSRARWLPITIARYMTQNPGIHIAVIEGSHSELSGQLRDGDIDMMLGALRDPAHMEGLKQQEAFEDRPAIIMRAGHALSRRNAIDPRQLVACPWILPDRRTPLRGYWEEMLRACEVEPPHVAVECGSVLTIRELLLGGNGLSLLSPDQMRVEIDAGLIVTRPPPAPVRRTIGITTRENWRPTASQAAFIDTLLQVATD